MKVEKEIKDMKVVLLALWQNLPHPDAQKVVNRFAKELK